jgi:hypothetical protein
MRLIETTEVLQVSSGSGGEVVFQVKGGLFIQGLFNRASDKIAKVFANLFLVDLDDFAELFGYTVSHGGLLPWLNFWSRNLDLTIARPPPQNVRKILYVILCRQQ